MQDDTVLSHEQKLAICKEIAWHDPIRKQLNIDPLDAAYILLDLWEVFGEDPRKYNEDVPTN